jgi:hypothetical protein
MLKSLISFALAMSIGAAGATAGFCRGGGGAASAGGFGGGGGLGGVGHGGYGRGYRGYGYGGVGYGNLGYGYGFGDYGAGYGAPYTNNTRTIIQPGDDSNAKYNRAQDKRRQSLPTSAFVKTYNWPKASHK